MCGTVDVEDDKACLHHRAVAEYLVSDAVSPRQLAVAVPAVRQVMAEAVMRWLAPVLDDTETAADTGTLSLSPSFLQLSCDSFFTHARRPAAAPV